MSAPRPSSFLGGPFLVNVLHRLPIPLVDAIFNNPRTFNDTFSPSILFQAGLTTLSQVVRTILLESFPELPVEALNHLVSESTSSPFLVDLVSCWGLRWRALQLSVPSPEREEEVFVRIVGGIQLFKDGDSHVHQYLGAVMGDPVRELKVELETNGEDDVRSLFVKRQLQAPPSQSPAPPPVPPQTSYPSRLRQQPPEPSTTLLQHRCSLLGMTLAFETMSRDKDAISTVVVVAGGRFSADGKGESVEEAKKVASRLLLESGILPEPMEAELEIVNGEPSSSVNHHRAPSNLVEPGPLASSFSTPATRPSLHHHEDISAPHSAQDLVLQTRTAPASLESGGEASQPQVESNEDGETSTSSHLHALDPEEKTKKKKKKKRSSTQLASVDFSLPSPQPIPSTSTLSGSHPDLPESSSTPFRISAAQASSSSLPFDQLSLSSNVDESSQPSPLVPPERKPKLPTIPSTPSRSARGNPRQRLSELATQLGLEPPSFKSKPMRKDERGVDVFLEKVFVGEHSEKGTGWTKELAQQKACRKLIESGELGGMEGVE